MGRGDRVGGARTVGGGTALALAFMLLAACAETPAPKPVAAAAAVAPTPVVCADVRFSIYFTLNSDQLTAEARQLIAGSAARVRGCRIGALDVVGLAAVRDAKGQGLAISERRAVNVADAMKAAGLPAPNFQLDAEGKAGARTKRGFAELLRRRADVVIHAAPAA